MLPHELERKLGEWDDGIRDDVPKPRVLYVIPNGANPSGASLVSGVLVFVLFVRARVQ